MLVDWYAEELVIRAGIVPEETLEVVCEVLVYGMVVSVELDSVLAREWVTFCVDEATETTLEAWVLFSCAAEDWLSRLVEELML